jgi:hypothetical protein
MSDYESTVRVSLSRLDTEEIIEKLSQNQLTEGAAIIAEEILKERGVSTTVGTGQDQVSSSDTQSVSSENISYVGYPASAIFIWMAAAFLFGINQTVKLSGAAPDAPGVVMVRLSQGFFYFLLAGIVFGIYAYANRTKITTRDEVVKKYGSNIKTIIVVNIITLCILVVSLFFGHSSSLAFIDIAIIALLTVAIFGRMKPAKYLLAIYAFMSPVVFAFLGYGGPGGIVWSFIFLTCCQAIAAEKRFSEITD